MFQADQQARTRATKSPNNTTLWYNMGYVDALNTARMKLIVHKYGWPGRSLVGDNGANWAWALIQHADSAPAFQRQCLVLMGPAVHSGDVPKDDYALLTDRVLLAEGKSQVYGTQFKRDAQGALVPEPIADVADVDDRRKGVGLPPLAEYRQTLEKVYGTKPAPHSPPK